MALMQLADEVGTLIYLGASVWRGSKRPLGVATVKANGDGSSCSRWQLSLAVTSKTGVGNGRYGGFWRMHFAIDQSTCLGTQMGHIQLTRFVKNRVEHIVAYLHKKKSTIR